MTVRSMTRSDRDAVIAGFEHLSPAGRRLRFLSPTKHLTPGMAADLTAVDDNHLVLLAFDARGRVVGGARATRYVGDRSVADVAVTVGDHLQGRGLATRLLRYLGEEAHRAGIDRLAGHVLVDNTAAQRLLVSARAVISFDEPGVLAFEIPLGRRRTVPPEQAARRQIGLAS